MAALMLQNCFFDFAVEHQFSLRATEPGFAGDIGAVEIWLSSLFVNSVTWFALLHRLPEVNR